MWFFIIVLGIAVICLWSKLVDVEAKLNRLSANVDGKKAADLAVGNNAAKIVVKEVDPPSALAPPTVLKKPVEKEPEKVIKPEPVAAKKAIDWEKLLLGNMFNKLGAIALIVGVAIFIKLISPFFVFTPLRQVIATYVFGLALTMTAWRIHHKEMKAYAAVLMGTGFAIFFVATYGATSYYHLMPDWLALFVGTLLVLASYGVAQRFKTLSTMLIGMVAAYANPLIIGHFESVEFLFSYFIFVNAITVAYVCVNKGKYLLNYINLMLTAAYLLAYSFYWVSIDFTFPLLLWLVYMLSDFVSARQGYKAQHAGLSALNYALLILFAGHVFGVENAAVIGSVLAGIGVLYLLLSLCYRKLSSTICAVYCSSGMLALLAAPYFVEQESLRLGIWAVMGLLCALVHTKRAVPHFEKWSMAFSLAASLACLYSLRNMTDMCVFFNLRSVHFGMAIVALLGCSLMLWRSKATFAHVMCFFALLMSYIYALIEVNAFLNGAQILSAYGARYIDCIMLFCFVASAMALYQFTRLKLFAVTAYGSWIIVAMTFALNAHDATFTQSHYPFLNMGLAGLIAAVVTGGFVSYVIRKNMSIQRIIFAHVMEWAVFCLSFLWVAQDISSLCLSPDVEMLLLINVAWIAAVSAMWLCRKLGNDSLGVTAHLVFYIALGWFVVEGTPYLDSADITPILNGGVLTYLFGIGAALTLAHHTGKWISPEFKFYPQFLRFLAFLQGAFIFVIELARVTSSVDNLYGGNEACVYILAALAIVSAARMFYLKSRFVLYHILSCILYPLSCLILFAASMDLTWNSTLMPIVNMITLAYVALIALTSFIAQGSKNQFFHYFTLFVGFVFVGLQACHMTLGWSDQSAEIAISIAWVLYSAVLMTWGILKNTSYLKISGSIIVIFSALKIIFYDLSRVDALSKTIAFILLGVVLMAVSYYYTKKYKA